MLYFLIVITLLYLFFKLLGRYILPWLVKSYIKRVQKNFYQQNPNHPNNKEPFNKDGIRIDHIPEMKTKSQNSGEYVEFEEIN